MPPNNGIIIVPRAKGGNTASTQNNSSGAAKIRIIQFPKRLGVTILRKMRRIFVDGANAYENGDCVGVGRWVLGFGVAEKRSVRSLCKLVDKPATCGMGTGERKTDPVHKPLKRPLLFVSLVE